MVENILTVTLSSTLNTPTPLPFSHAIFLPLPLILSFFFPSPSIQSHLPWRGRGGGGGGEKSLFFRRGQHSQACTIPHPINRAHTHVQPKHKRSDRYSYCGKHNFHIWTASCQRDERVTDVEAPDWQRLGWFTLTLVHALLLRSPSSLSFIISSNSALEPGLWFMLRIWLAHGSTVSHRQLTRIISTQKDTWVGQNSSSPP